MTDSKQSDAYIHLRVPAATKGRWVFASRKKGQKLSDFITEAVEKHIEQEKLNEKP